jgi:hypothetical protein
VVQEQMISGAHQSSALCQRDRRNTTGRIDDMCKQQRDFGIFFNSYPVTVSHGNQNCPSSDNLAQFSG